ncbi:hypothetical protein BCR44DRAFT_1436722 [Catenaria anguillulae PL171]|uniref:BTB domain-containing protein n=1 Tax=Catenaria anguillulae PL171 TaxID=765915 RepID=A0A1Y2HM49_9FUNG|nr:hypothetical protein BCR44DRAFT_1436722 [Catenaria anguillulae PL171]
MTVPTFQFTLPASLQQSASTGSAAAAADNGTPSGSAAAPQLPTLPSLTLAESMAKFSLPTMGASSTPAFVSLGSSDSFNGFTMPAFKAPTTLPTTATTLTFNTLSPTGFQDLHSLDVRSKDSQMHPQLGKIGLVLRTGLVGPGLIDAHVLVGGAIGPSVKVSVTVTLHVVYSNEGSGDLIPLRGGRRDTSNDGNANEASPTNSKSNNVQSTLTSSIRIAALASPTPATATTGSVYTVTLPHDLLPSSTPGCESANLMHIKQAIVSLDLQSNLSLDSKKPLFQLPTSTPTPTPLGLVSSLNQPLLCDASILPKDEADPIHVSRAVLACTSPYFRTMFSGNWAESTSSTTTPITLPYPAAVVIPCLVHMYTHWVPAEPMPDTDAVAKLLRKYKVDVKAFDRHMWSDVMDLADMWELHKLVLGANRALVHVLNADHAKRSGPVRPPPTPASRSTVALDFRLSPRPKKVLPSR